MASKIFLVSYIGYEGMKRTEPLEIPEAALREVIYNALIHRLYTGTFIQMKVYNDRISLWNEGTLPEGFPIAMLLQEHSSRQRNPLIANVFFLAGFVETWGRGIKKVQKALQGVGLPDPVFDESCGGIRVTIQRPRNIANLGAFNGGDFGDDSFPENQRISFLERQLKLDFGDDFGDEKQVYTVIMASPEISQPQIAKITKISPRSVSRIVGRLKEYGYLRRVGSDRKGSWECLK